MFKMLNECLKSKSSSCNICSDSILETYSTPDACKDAFHYKCLRSYIENKLEKNDPLFCPMCEKFFGRIANKHKNSEEVIYQNVILSQEESQCFICFNKLNSPVACSDSCSHSYCYECYKKWCTCKHECPMDRLPVKILLLSDFPGSHVIKRIEPPPIEQDINGDGDNDEILNTICEVCNMGNNDDLLLLCDSCNKGYHIYCLRNPLNEIPEGDWFCDDCNESSEDDDLTEFGILPRGINRVISNIEERMRSRTGRNRARINTRRAAAAANNVINTVSLYPLEEMEIITRSRRLQRVNSENNSLENENDISGPIVPISRPRRNLIVDSDESNNETNQVQSNSESLNALQVTNVLPTSSTSNPSNNRRNRNTNRRNRTTVRNRRRPRGVANQESQSSEAESEYDGIADGNIMMKSTDEDFVIDEEDDDYEIVLNQRKPNLRKNNSNRSTKRKHETSNERSESRVGRKKPRVVYNDDDSDNSSQQNHMIPSTSSASSGCVFHETRLKGRNSRESSHNRLRQTYQIERNRHISGTSSSSSSSVTLACAASDSQIKSTIQSKSKTSDDSENSSETVDDDYESDSSSIKQYRKTRSKTSEQNDDDNDDDHDWETPSKVRSKSIKTRSKANKQSLDNDDWEPDSSISESKPKKVQPKEKVQNDDDYDWEPDTSSSQLNRINRLKSKEHDNDDDWEPNKTSVRTKPKKPRINVNNQKDNVDDDDDDDAWEPEINTKITKSKKPCTSIKAKSRPSTSSTSKKRRKKSYKRKIRGCKRKRKRSRYYGSPIKKFLITSQRNKQRNNNKETERPKFAQLMPTVYDRLNINGRGNNVPYLGDCSTSSQSEGNFHKETVTKTTVIKQPKSTNSIIDSITESQSNLFSMTLKNITRHSDGTIEMKPQSPIISTISENDEKTFAPTTSNLIKKDPIKIINPMQTANSIIVNGRNNYTTNKNNKSHQIDSNSSSQEQHQLKMSIKKVKTSDSNNENIYESKLNLMPSTSNTSNIIEKTSSQSPVNVDEDDKQNLEHIRKDIHNYFVNKVYDKYQDLTKKELTSIEERVFEKVRKKLNTHKVNKHKLAEFVSQYIKYYRDKKKKMT